MKEETSEKLLELRGLKAQIKTDLGIVKAVDGVSLAVNRNRTLCIVGESGCGKSFMARSITQLAAGRGKTITGEILFSQKNGRTVDIGKLDPKGPEIRRIRGREISMIFQEPMTSLSPVHSIGNQIAEAALLHFDINKAEARDRTIEVLRRVGLPKPEARLDAYPFQLSGGMRQRAMIAMALICKPSLLIADEPTTALDVTTQAVILDLMRNLQDELGMGVIFITHDLGVVAEIADDVAVMYLGRVVESGPVSTIFHDPKHPYTRSLLKAIPHLGSGKRDRLISIPGIVPHPFDRPAGCAFHTRCPSFMPGLCDRLEPPLKHFDDQTSASCHLFGEDAEGYPVAHSSADKHKGVVATPDSRNTPAAPLLEVRDLKLHFPIRSGKRRKDRGFVKAVDGVSFDIRKGETIALVGESGCGKSTLSRCLMRIYEPTAGEIRYHTEDGDVVDLAPMSRKELKQFHREMRMIFQDPHSSLNPRMTVFDIVGESLMLHGVASKADRKEKVTQLLTEVGLQPDYMSRFPHAFSGGERQRIGIARALALAPRLVVADEAVSALDVSVQAQILNLLKDLQGRLGLTYLFVAHDLSVVEHISDRVAVMYVGKFVEIADTATIYGNCKHPYTEALLSAVPKPDPKFRDQTDRIRLGGEVADPVNPPSGCFFHPRCRYSDGNRCVKQTPQIRDVGPNHQVACHFAEELELRGIAEDPAELRQ